MWRFRCITGIVHYRFGGACLFLDELARVLIKDKSFYFNKKYPNVKLSGFVFFTLHESRIIVQSAESDK
jgi:uncharacterized membrane protein